MNISELIEALQDLQAEYGDIEVTIATQPSYPLAFELDNVAFANDQAWLVSGRQADNPYVVPGEVWGY